MSGRRRTDVRPINTRRTRRWMTGVVGIDTRGAHSEYLSAPLQPYPSYELRSRRGRSTLMHIPINRSDNEEATQPDPGVVTETASSSNRVRSGRHRSPAVPSLKPITNVETNLPDVISSDVPDNSESPIKLSARLEAPLEAADKKAEEHSFHLNRTTGIMETLTELPARLELRQPLGVRFEPTDTDRRIRRRRSVGSTVRYLNQTNRKFRRKGPHALYLKPVTDGSSLEVTEPQGQDAQICFRVHNFEAESPNPEGGDIIILEANGGGYVHGTSSGTVSIMSEQAAASNTTQIDDRFFLTYRLEGDAYVRIKHLTTGQFLSASSNDVSLVTSPQTFTDSLLFESFTCSNS